MAQAFAFMHPNLALAAGDQNVIVLSAAERLASGLDNSANGTTHVAVDSSAAEVTGPGQITRLSCENHRQPRSAPSGVPRTESAVFPNPVSDPGSPMHIRLYMAAQDTAVMTFRSAAAVLGQPDPLVTAMQADSDPDVIKNIADNVRRRKDELQAAHDDLYSGIGTLMTAWRGQRHDKWTSHANDALMYYQPTGIRRPSWGDPGGRAKLGVLALTDKTAKAAGSVATDLDTATKGVADDLIASAQRAKEASLHVLDGTATPEEIALVIAEVNAVANSVGQFNNKVSQITDKYLIKPNLDSTLPFDESNDQAGPSNTLHIDDNEFAQGLEKLDSSAALAAMARDGFNALMGITSTGGRSPFGEGASALYLATTWMTTVTSRRDECAQLYFVTVRLRDSAEEARREFHQVDQNIANMFNAIYGPGRGGANTSTPSPVS